MLGQAGFKSNAIRNVLHGVSFSLFVPRIYLVYLCCSVVSAAAREETVSDKIKLTFSRAAGGTRSAMVAPSQVSWCQEGQVCVRCGSLPGAIVIGHIPINTVYHSSSA